MAESAGPVSGRVSRTALQLMNKLTGVQASKTNDTEIHVNFNILYKRTTICEYFVKIESLRDGSWRVFSHSLPHYLPMEAILRKHHYGNPTEIVEDIHQFLEALAKRKGQVLAIKARYPTQLRITNTASHHVVRLYFTGESKMKLLIGTWFDLRYTLLGEFPGKVSATLPESTSSELTAEDNKDLQTIIKGFKKHPITTVIRTILED